MTRQYEPILAFLQCSQDILNYFHCPGDFFIKPLLDSEWVITKSEDYHFLSYWLGDDQKMECVVVMKRNKPLIFTRGRYTMIIAIDCVKIAFIFLNKYQIGY